MRWDDDASKITDRNISTWSNVVYVYGKPTSSKHSLNVINSVCGSAVNVKRCVRAPCTSSTVHMVMLGLMGHVEHDGTLHTNQDKVQELWAALCWQSRVALPSSCGCSHLTQCSAATLSGSRDRIFTTKMEYCDGWTKKVLMQNNGQGGLTCQKMWCHKGHNYAVTFCVTLAKTTRGDHVQAGL